MTFLCRARAVTPRLTLGMAAPYAYGSIAATALAFVAWTLVEPRNCRLFLVVLLVRMWSLNACERLIEPFPRTRKRFLAPDLVFIFGMMPFLYLLPTAVLSGAWSATGEASLPCGLPVSG